MYVTDLFCGGGGFSEGARLAGNTVVLAIDNWEDALTVHVDNHPECEHWCMTLGGNPDEFVARVRAFIDEKVPRGAHLHVHASPPCQNLSKLNVTRRDTGKGLEMVEWSLGVISAIAPTTWTMEQVATPLVVKFIESRGLPHAVINMEKYGLAQTRRRLFVGTTDMAKLSRFEGTTTMRQLFADINYTPPTKTMRTCSQLRYYRNFDTQSYTVVSGGYPVFFDTHTKKGTSIPISVLQAIQGFPVSYSFAKVNSSIARRVVGNSVPPSIACKIMQSQV